MLDVNAVFSSNRSCEFLANSDASTVLKIEPPPPVLFPYFASAMEVFPALSNAERADKFVTIIFLMQH
jgi:hypothetical protein